MSKHAGLKLAIAALVVGGGLYLALEWLRPYHHVEVKMEGLVPAEQVFAATAASGDEGSSPSTEAAPPAPAPAAVEAPAAAQGAAEVAAEPPPADTQKPSSEAAAEVKVVPPPKAPPPAVEKKPAPKARPAEAATKTGKASSPNHEAEDSGKAWWQSTASSSGFSVIYAGSAAFRRALVVMGNAPFASADSANTTIKVLDASGKPVSGHWELNSVNPSMLVFPLADLGVYRVQIGAALSDRQNRTLGTALQGSIQVR
ncbi:hypothetical protein SAMN04488038_113140 [Solimonas aquatica]|uniref:Uncharacterized protein n=1 Tax=Solimonas aquatica TaxID=489703 RepID=A0A1H9KJJ3_9GAMM|nr:hypothetical protein [Solimonas aquatica]SEQ99272.1 hypothetical protein SAMN04488038_113140 [Solimonas aquatica]